MADDATMTSASPVTAHTAPAQPWAPRVVCPRCRRPASVCYCGELCSIPTRTKVVLLQHPRERDMAIGTAKMASLCLPNARLHVGVDWDQSPALAAALSDPTHPAALLYPGPEAIDVARTPPPGPITLVVVDGTWSQASKLVRRNEVLRTLPRYAFTPPRPSDYRIRREPREDFVSTIEALVHVLGALEGDPDRFTPMLVPFRAMIDRQLEHIAKQHAPRGRRTPRPVRAKPRLPAILHERAADLVCVFADADGLPHDHPSRDPSGLSQLLRWVAIRPATGEGFAEIIAPTGPMWPTTPAQLELPEAALHAGIDADDFVTRWRRFTRDTDVLVSWGVHSLRLLARSGARHDLPAVDLRRIVSQLESRRPGSIEKFHAGRGLPDARPFAPGRAARRVAQLADVLADVRAHDLAVIEGASRT